MNNRLSVLCVTNAEHERAGWFIQHFRTLATAFGAELVLGLDGDRAQAAPWRDLADKAINLRAKNLQEDVLDQAVAACDGEWILRLDDDETVSPMLELWISTRGYVKARADLYAFPRVYLYPDEKHFLVNPGMYPDVQTRLGKRALMFGVNCVHAGNPHGTGRVVPYALEHHKLLVRDRASRQAIADRYENLRPGAGYSPEYAKFNIPESVFPELITKEYPTCGDFSTR